MDGTGSEEIEAKLEEGIKEKKKVYAVIWVRNNEPKRKEDKKYDRLY